jgi:hypothetical protein
MDEHKLTELFQSAVRDVPPASFDDQDIAAAARRATAHRRNMFIGGSVFVVVVLAGLVFGSGVLGSSLNNNSASSGSAAVPGQAFGTNNGAAPRAGGQAQQAPGDGSSGSSTTTPVQGGGGAGGVGPGAGGTPSGCGPTDSELAVALANELASVGAPKEMPPNLTCPAGARSAGYLVHDGSAIGYIVVIVTTPGETLPNDTAIGAARASAPASKGRTVTVLSVPSAGSPSAPLSGAIFGMAEDLAGKV